MKIGDIVSLIRTTARQNSDDTTYSSEYLYRLVQAARARLISQSRSREDISKWDWQTVCIKLTKEKFHNCDCIEIGCDVLKSTIDIPRVVTVDKMPLIEVETFAGETLHYVKPKDQITNRHSDILKNALGYYIQNNKLIVWNTLSLKALMIKGVFSNPIDLANINICNQDGDIYDQCTYDPLYQNFPMDDKNIDVVVDMVLNRLGYSLQIPKDIKNDSV